MERAGTAGSPANAQPWLSVVTPRETPAGSRFFCVAASLLPNVSSVHIFFDEGERQSHNNKQAGND